MGFFGRNKKASASTVAVPVTGVKKVEKHTGTAPLREREVLIGPHITEKTASLTSHGTYVFEVKRQATRVEVAQAVARLYGIKPRAVRMQVVRANSVRSGRFRGKQSSWKKALVTLPMGKTIDVYEAHA